MWVTETWEDRIQHGLKVAETLFDARSPYQHVQIVRTEFYGRVLLLDGMFQTSEADEYLYHEPMVHPLMALVPDTERVLVVGGGDGGTAREVLRYPAVQQVVMCEIDELVVAACKQHMPALGGDAWHDPRLDLRFCDAAEHVRQAEPESYDAILVDGSDPIGPGAALFAEDFFAHCKRVLKPGGLYVMQSGSPFLTRDGFLRTVRGLREAFGEARPYLGSVPLYGAGPWSWTLAGERVSPEAANFERSASFRDELRHYSAAMHAAGFTLPPEFVRALEATS